MRGYFGIGIYQTKTEANIGTLWRSAFSLGASFIFTIGKRYRTQASDTVKAERHIPLYEYLTFEDFLSNRPKNCLLIGVENGVNGKALETYGHPERAIYILGSEDNGLPKNILDNCNSVIEFTSKVCLNVAVAGSIIMYDRQMKTK